MPSVQFQKSELSIAAALQIVLRRIVLLLLVCSFPAVSVELWSNEEGTHAGELNATLKLTGLGSYSRSTSMLVEDHWAGQTLGRIRLDLRAYMGDKADAHLAYEQRLSLTSGSGGGLFAGQGMLPSVAKAPYRIGQLDWQIYDSGDSFTWRHELDRISLALHPEWGEVTIGRQAIGLGRGMIFSAVDVFNPFNPLEIDREWRRGIDAFRMEYRLSDTTSTEIIAAFGRDWEHSALLGRLRGYLGQIDGELIIGKRGRDMMYAGVMSATIGDAAAHLELAVFDTHEKQRQGGLFGNEHLVGKAVLGTSYTFDVGNGLTLIGEYHYSGFGLKKTEDALCYFLDPTYQERFLRGDSQILGQHALGVQSMYSFNESWQGGLLLLKSLGDESGVISPSLIWTVSETTSVIMSVYVPWGPSISGLELQSEYGAAPISMFLQMTAYF